MEECVVGLTMKDVEGYFQVINGEVFWSTLVSGKRSGNPVLNKHKLVSFKGITYRFKDIKALVLGELLEIFPNSKSAPDSYHIWNAMKGRCKERGYPISAIFSKYETWFEWANFQSGFKELDLFNKPFNLDSDIFSDSIKTYSEDTCVFIPQHLNQVYKISYKGNQDIGVDYFKGKYRARICIFNNQVALGAYERKEDAVVAYRSKRAEYIQLLLNAHRHQLDDKTIKFIEDDINNNISI